MRRTLVGLALALLVFSPVSAAGGNGLPPTIVTFNGDGSVTFSTDAPDRVTKYCSGFNGCNLRVNYGDGTLLYSVGGDGSTLTLLAEQVVYWACPCTAEFWAHGGQWRPYSAVSDVFFN
jgi:hypothetical protein